MWHTVDGSVALCSVWKWMAHITVGTWVEVCLLHTVAHFGWKCLTAAHWGPPAMLSARAKGKTVAKMQTDELLQKLANSIYAITNQPQCIHLSSVSITPLLLRQGNCLCVVSCGKSDFFCASSNGVSV